MKMTQTLDHLSPLDPFCITPCAFHFSKRISRNSAWGQMPKCKYVNRICDNYFETCESIIGNIVHHCNPSLCCITKPFSHFRIFRTSFFLRSYLFMPFDPFLHPESIWPRNTDDANWTKQTQRVSFT